jgi:hypothetical protein
MNRTLLIITALAILTLALPASAQLINGDFEDPAGIGWGITLPNPDWTGEIRPAGGNPDGYAYLMSWYTDPLSEGTGLFGQTFDCGDDPANVCVITLDYSHGLVDASSLSGRVVIYIDGVLVHTSPPVDYQPWTTVTFSVPCGIHLLEMGLEVDAGNNAWEACFDNVRAECDDSVPTIDRDWGDIKALF